MVKKFMLLMVGAITVQGVAANKNDLFAISVKKVGTGRLSKLKEATVKIFVDSTISKRTEESEKRWNAAIRDKTVEKLKKLGFSTDGAADLFSHIFFITNLSWEANKNIALDEFKQSGKASQSDLILIQKPSILNELEKIKKDIEDTLRAFANGEESVGGPLDYVKPEALIYDHLTMKETLYLPSKLGRAFQFKGFDRDGRLIYQSDVQKIVGGYEYVIHKAASIEGKEGYYCPSEKHEGLTAGGNVCATLQPLEIPVNQSK